ncbi:MAG: class I SAM-dependent methyltransferase [Syntrophomonadaceae bacterium]|jgi:ubiquinone/menaquinone biosynthesis C-methylase UbiE|nr:methyltransferase domain-containing protein [Bacillota bacterium]NLP23142.1 methyltransferase domain-containing protein [Syntrophomonadaceae bacterium]
MSSKDWHEYSEDEILQANIEKYQRDDIVKFYEDFEEPRYTYIEYQIILAAVLRALRQKLGRPVRAVDMCGGAGKAAFIIKSIQPDSEVTLVDLSDKMLDIARQRAAKLCLDDLHIVEADAFSFLEQENEYDLFVYSSALHHFKNPVELLELSAGRMHPQGMIVSIADPTTLIKSRRYRFFQFLATNREIKRHLIKECFQRMAKRSPAQKTDFDLAEYQTYTGIDDHQLCQDLSGVNLHPLLHLRYPAGEPYMTKIMPYLGLCWAFSTVLCASPTEYQHQVQHMKKEISSELPFRIRFF